MYNIILEVLRSIEVRVTRCAYVDTMMVINQDIYYTTHRFMYFVYQYISHDDNILLVITMVILNRSYYTRPNFILKL